jgi:hypothetical protein
VKKYYSVEQITKKMARPVLEEYHYLTGIAKDFRSGYNYGLFHHRRVCGVTIFTGIAVPELPKSIFGIENQDGLFELSRLALASDIQEVEHNITSWFVARAIKQFRKDADVKAILSYADSDYHIGTIYSALNFKYYGLTDPKKDFWFNDGTKHSRGKVAGREGEWRDRSRKHRYLMVFDKSLKVIWNEQTRPS